jgi:hypothetical protein
MCFCRFSCASQQCSRGGQHRRFVFQPVSTGLDNLPVEDARWGEKFHDRLQVDLCAKEGTYDIRIWRDHELDGNQKFDHTLQAKLEKSAICCV